MSSRTHSSNESPVNQRRTMTASQMDAIGRIDEETGQPLDPEKSKVTPPASPGRAVVASSSDTLEIGTRVDLGRPVEVPPLEIDDEEEDDDVDADLERLLASTTSDGETVRAKQQTASSRCCGCQQGPGNFVIVFPRVYARTGWGILGPHWFGPVFVFLIILWASHFFIKRALEIGPVTTAFCILMSIITTWNLCEASFRDPGIVTYTILPDNVDVTRWRWCDFCNVYQPPSGQHCHDCNVCVEGYDHHCVWMGTCIGKNNFRQFIRFNLSWLLYLVYAIAWVCVLGPAMYKKHRD